MQIELRQIFGQKTEENSCKKFRENPVKLVNLKVQIQIGWSQIETEIYCTDITTSSSFSYLKELVILKVRALTDGLIFNTEEYGKATTILRVKFE